MGSNTYDAANRVKTTSFPAATAQNITYTYDQTTGGNVGVGRLTGVTDVSGSTAFVYDAQGRVTSDTKTIGSHSYGLSYSYDTSGRVTQITYPSGRIVTITRAADGLPSAIATKLNSGAAAQNVATNISYQPFGPLASLTYGNGLTLTRSYDANYWLSGVKVANGGTNLLSLTYGRDSAARLIAVTDNASTGRGGTYAYTNANRLSQGIGPWGEEDYTYDASGNRTTLKTVISGITTTETDTISTTTNRISTTAIGGATKRTLSFRTGGELTSDAIAGGSTYNFGYDALNRLTSVKQGSTTVGTYGYNAFTEMVTRVIGTSTLNYIYDEAGHLLAEQDGGTGAVRREYVWLDDRLIAFVDSTSGSALPYYVSAGHTDAPLLVTNASKAVVWNSELKPFGAAQFLATATETLDQRFPGQWLEAVAEGLNHNGYRDYDPTLGRYIEPDPLGISAGQNPYTYVDGSPIEHTDVKGLWFGEDDAVAILGGAAIGMAGQAAADAFNGHLSGWREYAGSAAQGALVAEGALYGPLGGAIGGALGGLARDGLHQKQNMHDGIQCAFNSGEWFANGAVGGAIGGAFGGAGKLIKGWRVPAELAPQSPTPYQIGAAGEAAVRDVYDIGDKFAIDINENRRIPDGLTSTTVSEVKNVANLSYTQQLRDYAAYAQQTVREFDLYVRPTTKLSAPLQDAIQNGQVNLKYIPN